MTCPYQAGETVLTINNTGDLKPGDVLQLTAIIPPQTPVSPKFNLAEELGYHEVNSPSLKGKEENSPIIPSNQSELEGLPLGMVQCEPAPTKPEPQLPWEAEVNMIGERLQEIRTTRTVNVFVEAVLSDHQVQITPTWLDLPQGATIQKTRSSVEIEEAKFIEHLGLDWQIWVDDKLVSFAEYKKRVLLQQKGLELNSMGDICANGISLKKTMPPEVYETFLKGIEAELADFEVEIPHVQNANTQCRGSVRQTRCG